MTKQQPVITKTGEGMGEQILISVAPPNMTYLEALALLGEATHWIGQEIEAAKGAEQ